MEFLCLKYYRKSNVFRGNIFVRKMLLKLILAFVALPLLDLIVLIKVAELIGLLETIAIVVLTGLIGAGLAKKEGLATWRKFKHKLGAGEPISGELANGILIIVGSAFLLTPGLITDTLGSLLIIPPTRKRIKKWLKNYLGRRVTSHQIRPSGFIEK